MKYEICDTFLKIFLTILLFTPFLVITLIIITISLVANILTLLYFTLFGWLCELDFCNCHGPFIIESLSAPWEILINFYKKIYEFYKKSSLEENKGHSPI